MNKKTARKIADSLTWARVFSVVPITVLACYELKWWVFGLYIAAALTDLLDGIFARRGAPPATDIDFDGLADLLFSVMTLLWLWLLIPGFFPKYWLPYLPVLVSLEIYTISARIRYPQLTVPHLEFGRIAMALFCFLLPVLIVWDDVPWFVHLVFIIGTAGKIQLGLAVVSRVRIEQSDVAND
jgi:phosphatidylglycerophosphate synthase